jgi:hypothetical protein
VALLVALAVAALPPRPWVAITGFGWAAVALAALPQRPPSALDWRRFARRMDLAPGSPRDVLALDDFTAAPLHRYARAGMRVRVVTSLAQLNTDDAWLVFGKEAFVAVSTTDSLHALGYETLALLSAGAAGQKVVAVRLRRVVRYGRP